MNTPWIIGLFLATAFFAVFEALAFKHADRFSTLSHAVYTLGKTWPLSIWLMGMFAGGLAVHFFWHWCPDGGVGTGMLFIVPPSWG
jgi:predicted outer membrane lipoprotein